MSILLKIKSILRPIYNAVVRSQWRIRDNRIAPITTLFVNFRCLPFKQAIKLPIFFYKHTKIYSFGKIKISSKKVFAGMIKIGKIDFKCTGHGKFANYGEIVFCDETNIFGGCTIENYGTINLCGYNAIGEGTTFLIRDSLIVGKYSRI